MSRQAQDNGAESFEEADDFDLDESEIDDSPTPYDVPEVEMRPENNEVLDSGPDPIPHDQAPQPAEGGAGSTGEAQ
jgi:hypothetical protein